jgi:hypothetical protein
MKTLYEDDYAQWAEEMASTQLLLRIQKYYGQATLRYVLFQHLANTIYDTVPV